jgi:hypothetical protein
MNHNTWCHLVSLGVGGKWWAKGLSGGMMGISGGVGGSARTCRAGAGERRYSLLACLLNCEI